MFGAMWPQTACIRRFWCNARLGWQVSTVAPSILETFSSPCILKPVLWRLCGPMAVIAQSSRGRHRVAKSSLQWPREPASTVAASILQLFKAAGSGRVVAVGKGLPPAQHDTIIQRRGDSRMGVLTGRQTRQSVSVGLSNVSASVDQSVKLSVKGPLNWTSP